MQSNHQEVAVNNPENGDDVARESREVRGRTYADLGQQPSSPFTQQLGVALSRAFERRIGKAPSQEDLNKAVNALGGTKASAFVQHVVRVQEQLACLHTRLQMSQEQHTPATDAVQDISVPSIESKKRSLGPHDNSLDPPREAKRTRRESAEPRSYAPPSNLEHEANPVPPTPDTPMFPKDVPVAPRSMRSDPRFAELPRADLARPQATVDSPLRPPITGIKQPILSNHAKSNSGNVTGQRQPPNDTVDGDSHGNQGLTMTVSQIARPKSTSGDPSLAETSVQNTLQRAPSPSISTSRPESKQPLLTTLDTRLEYAIASNTEISSNCSASPATAMGAPAYTRPQIPSSAPPTPFVANVPGIWAIQVGKPSASQIDIPFDVDQDTANSVRRWAAHKKGFDPNARHVVVNVVALQATAVAAAQQSLSQSPGGITPQAFVVALRDLQPKWPDDGSLVLQLNAGQTGEQTWFTSDMLAGQPLDVSDAVHHGTNSLCVMQLKNMTDVVFAVYASPPSPGALAAALEWERQRKLFSFRRPPSRRLLG